MRTKTLLASTALAMVAFAGNASAATLPATTQLQAEVEYSCAFSAPAVVDAGVLNAATPSVVKNANLSVTCPTGTDYSIGATGSTLLNGTSMGQVMPVNIYKGDGTAYGQVASGSEYTGVGAGVAQSIPFQVGFNQMPASSDAAPLPIYDTYLSNLAWTLSF